MTCNFFFLLDYMKNSFMSTSDFLLWNAVLLTEYLVRAAWQCLSACLKQLDVVSEMERCDKTAIKPKRKGRKERMRFCMLAIHVIKYPPAVLMTINWFRGEHYNSWLIFLFIVKLYCICLGLWLKCTECKLVGLQCCLVEVTSVLTAFFCFYSHLAKSSVRNFLASH